MSFTARPVGSPFIQLPAGPIIDTSIFKSRVPEIEQSTHARDFKHRLTIYTYSRTAIRQYRARLAMKIMGEAADRAHTMSSADLAQTYVNVGELLFPRVVGSFEASTRLEITKIPVSDAELAYWVAAGANPNPPPAAATPGGQAPQQVVPAMNIFGVDLAANTDSTQINPEAVVGRFALLTLAMGKTYTIDNYVGVTERRVPSLMRMGRIPADEAGPLMAQVPSLEELQAYGAMLQLWTTIRIPLVQEYVSWISNAASSPDRRLFLAIFRLLDGADLGYVTMISDVLIAFPWVRDWAPTASETVMFLQGVKKFFELDEETRGFHALMTNQRTQIFRRADLGALNAIAVEYARSKDTKVGYFARDDRYDALVTQFTAEVRIRI